MQKKVYNPKEIEGKWAEIWEKNSMYKMPLVKDFTPEQQKKMKMHVLDMLPYPSGEGLHVGHAKVFGASDIYARMKRMQGFNVLHVTGWDAFGLPAEQFAIKMKINPKILTKKNTTTFERQMREMGFSYDWSRTSDTTDPKFYRWTQWIFKQLYKAGLCYESYEPINWCPSCKTGLANEDLQDGKCERCASVVEKKPIRQWVIRITDYAEKLLSGVDDLNWKESIKEMQRNWIGKSEGAEIDFKIKAGDTEDKFTIFTTRPDTLFGCTYCVFAPEHKLIQEYLNKNLISNKEAVEQYILESKNKSEIERSAEGKEKTGVKLEGVFAVNPANEKEVPVYVADFCLVNYGTGALMAVPAHDQRDFEFAKKFNIEIIKVILSNADKNNSEVNSEYGKLFNSGEFDGMESEEAKKKITEFVGGTMVTKYKLRDWVFARQRYWGEPFPIIFDENHKSYLVADSELPVVLPDVESYEPTGNGESPLADIKEFTDVYGYINSENEFVSCDKSDSKAKLFKRETNTMPQWAGSSWYWLRYMDPKNDDAFVDSLEEKYWGQVDIYLGGMEHATRHLIYGRFWNQFLYDKKYLSVSEPFQRLEAVGLVLGKGGVKMSKRLGNVVNPDDVIKQFGADTLRLYIAFAGDYHDDFSWDEKSIVGPRRFIERVWDMQYKIGGLEKNEELEILLNQTIKKVGEDFEQLKFNTAVSQMMIFANALEKQENINLEYYKVLLLLLAPICPFFTNEIWDNLFSVTGNGESMKSIHLSEWPKYDVNKIQNRNVNIAVQINGKLRDTFSCDIDLPDEKIIDLAKNTDGYKKWVVEMQGNLDPKKIIVIKNKVINIVI